MARRSTLLREPRWLLAGATLACATSAHAQTHTEVLRFDERGNIVQRIVNGQPSAYRYDGLDRLRGEGTPGNQVFDLDADGGRLVDGRSRYTVTPGGQRQATRDGIPVQHGPAGHVTADRTWLGGRWAQRQLDWNLAGQLETVRIDGVAVANYLYNDAGQRTRKTLLSPAPGQPAITLYRYDPMGNLVMEVAGSAVQAPGIQVSPGRVLVRYLWQDHVPVAVVWPAMTPGNPGGNADRIVYLHTDHLHTPRRATNERGQLVWHWSSDAFGSQAPQEDPDRDGVRVSIHLRFPGQYFDAESGLHYNWHRYYDPQVGRYTQADPIGLAGGINTYAYVGANPVSLADPDGLKAASSGWGGQGRQRPLPPMRTDGQPWGFGCGDSKSDHYVPDFFPKSCAAHDQCYAQQCGKATCDARFLRDMYNERPQMPAIPWLYFRAVDLFGDDAYRGAASPGRP